MPASGLSINAHAGTHTQQINYKREEGERERKGRKEGREERGKENVLNLTKKKKNGENFERVKSDKPLHPI